MKPPSLDIEVVDSLVGDDLIIFSLPPARGYIMGSVMRKARNKAPVAKLLSLHLLVFWSTLFKSQFFSEFAKLFFSETSLSNLSFFEFSRHFSLSAITKI